ncbi:MAG: DUF6531 domain-containing protein [Treponemataceae bacterium]|nr:DUF6531 domain-containing protein [Treponemataceae bacterium]
MRIRNFLSILLVIMAVQLIHARQKTITITEYDTVADPQHVTGNIYKADDGTEIELKQGQDPKDPKSYRVDGEDHGMPTASVSNTYTIIIDIPDEIYTEENQNFIESEFKNYCKQQYEATGQGIIGAGMVMKETVTQKFLNIIPYEKEYTAITLGKMETKVLSHSIDKIKASESVQIGDPVLMTSGQYRYDETDVIVQNRNLMLEIGRHYQSEENLGESLGRKWFFSLDTRIIRGSSISSEKTYEEALKTLATLEAELAGLRANKREAELEYNNSLLNLYSDIKTTNNAINSLRTSGYTSYSEVSEYIKNLSSKLTTLNELLTEIQTDKAIFMDRINTYIYEYETKLSAERKTLAKIKQIYDHSIYNRNKNSRAKEGNGFDEYMDIGTDIIILFDTYGRKSIYQLTTPPTYNGNEDLFPQGAETTSLSGGSDKLSILADGSYQLKKRDGTIWHYGDKGMLGEITDRYGNSISISYEGEKPISINIDGKNAYRLEWCNNRLCTIVNARDNSDYTEYSYTDGRLSSVKDNDGDSISFGYMDAPGDYLTTIQKPDGSEVLIDYSLEREGRKLASRTRNEEGFWENFSYSQSGKKVEHTSQSGIKTIYEYDDDQRLTKETDCDGSTKEYEYDEDGNVISEKVNGNITTYEYNNYGEKIRACYSDGSQEAWQYDDFGSVISYKDRDGIQYEYIRDNKGNLSTLNAGGRTLYTYEHDAKGQMKSATMHRADGSTVSRSFSYDEYGNLKERRSASTETNGGIREEWTYDGRGRILSYTINGNTEESYSYEGRKTTISYKNGLVSEYITDSRKDCRSILEKDSLTGEIRFTQISYDKCHQPVKRTISQGKGEAPVITALYRYLAGGEPEAELFTDGENCIVTLYEYKDQQGRQTDYLTKITRIQCVMSDLHRAGMTEEEGFSRTNLVELQAHAEDSYSVSYSYLITQNGTEVIETASDGTQTKKEYDAWARLYSITNTAGIKTFNEYTAAGRLEKQESEYGGFWLYQYDITGNLKETGPEGGKHTFVTMNPDETPFRVTDRKGQTSEYAYDDSGNLIKLRTPTGSTFWKYDYKGRLISEIIGGNGDTASAEEYSSYTYSPNGRSVTSNKGGLYSMIYTLNAWEETTSITDGEGNKGTFGYDCAGRLISQKDAYGNETKYEYDVRGLVTRINYPDGTYHQYKYDVFGNITEESFCGKSTRELLYDKGGRLKEEKGELTPLTSYEYDESGRLAALFSGGERKNSYEYDDRGRAVSIKDGRGNISLYEYDGFGKLISETNRLGLSQTFSYDYEDQLTEKKTFSGKVVKTETSADGLCKTTYYPDGSADIVTYDSAGRIKSISNETGRTRYEYDKGGMLTRQTDESTGESIIFIYDKAGRRKQIKGAGRDISLSYGKNGELIEIRDKSISAGFRIEYDSMMREIRRTGDNGVRTETFYNENGTVDIITTKDKKGMLLDAEAYVYDENGRKEALIRENGEITLFNYDDQGRLISVFHPDTKEIQDYENQIIKSYGIVEKRYNSIKSIYIQKNVYNKLADLQKLCNNITTVISVYRTFRVESFTYDENGNRKGWYIGGGLIEYSCDKDDRIVSCLSGGKRVKEYLYDDDGNLTSFSNPSVSGHRSYYTYDGRDRMISSISYGEDGIAKEKNYGYDAIGRRAYVSSSGKGTVRSTYDGFGFESLSENRTSEIYDVSSFTSQSKSKGASIPQGERYRYIKDGIQTDGRQRTKREESMTEQTGFRTRKSLYIKGIPAAIETDGESCYLSNDTAGSIRCITDSYGSFAASIQYDTFGTPVTISDKGMLSAGDSTTYQVNTMHKGRNTPDKQYTSDYDLISDTQENKIIDTVLSKAAYAGKPYDPVTGLYDYGFRDYSPALARFTTKDPIRDGLNWYAYCNNDPVNFVDMWGLKFKKRTFHNLMGDSAWRNELTGNGVDFLAEKGEIGQLRNTGCAITEMSNVISSATDIILTPKDINDDKSYFAAGTDNLYMQKLAEDNGLIFDYWTKNVQGDLGKKITELKNNKNEYLISAQVKYKEEDEKSHWVGITDVETREDGKTYAKIAPTSILDTSKSHRPRDSWVLDENGDMWIETSDINKIYTYKNK